MDIKSHIRGIPDFPKPGILFYDISTLLAHAQAWRYTIDSLAEQIAPFEPDKLVAIESRGFLVAAPLAYRLGIGFLMVRKPGKLPGDVTPFEYQLEYGSDTLEIQKDALTPGDKVVVMDDLLATGGTMNAAIQLLRSVGADVRAASAVIELSFLNGRDAIDVPFSTLVTYDS